MLLEGIPAAMIENSARMAGMPVGPLSLNDEVALDLGLKIVQGHRGRSRRRARSIRGQKKLLEEMVEKHGRLGRKNGKGFYDYPQGAPKRLWPGLADLQPKKLSREQVEALDVEELKQRFLVVQALEAARMLRGGRRHRRARGRRRLDPRLRLRAVLRRHAVLHRHDGDEDASSNCASGWRRSTARASSRRKLLLDMAKTDDRFYRRFAPGKKAA